MDSHAHVFNSVSGYCECGVQYLPYLRDEYPNGAQLGHTRLNDDYSATWVRDVQIVTKLGPFDTIGSWVPYAKD